MAMKKSKKSKKALSKLKSKNINYNKMGRQGLIKKEKSRLKSKEFKKLKRKSYFEHMNEEDDDEEEEIAGEMLLKLAAEDEMEAVLKKYYNKTTGDVGLQKSIQRKEKMKKFFEQLRLREGYKEMLPVLTDEGWVEQSAPITKQNTELELKSYKRDKFGKVQSQDKDKDGEEEGGEEGGEGGGGEGKESKEEKKEEKAKGKEGTLLSLEDIDEEHFLKEDEPTEVEIGEKSVAQIFAEKKRYIHDQKVKMACIAMNVVQDPSKLENLKFLMNMLTKIDPKENTTVYKYALMTVLQVFADLIPGYRIQEDNFEAKLKKEIHRMAKKEKTFLTYYKSYLKLLEKVLMEWKEDQENVGLRAVSETAAKCLGNLLENHPYFNFSVNLIQALVPFLNCGHPGIRKAIFNSLSKTIRNDQSCQLTLRIVRIVYRLTRRKEFRVQREVVQIFQSLRSGEMRNQDAVAEGRRASNNELSHKDKLIRKLSQKAQGKPSKKQKKERKKMAIIEKEMENITEEEIRGLQNQRHSEILEKMFGVYIRVLKMKAKSQLMTDVLEGLAKFAHLINMEFFSDLLKLMNEFLDEEVLDMRESLLCIQTVFTILSGQGEYLTVDPHRFYCQFYRIFTELTREEREKNLGSILEIVEQMLVLRRKRVSMAKVLSFTKRLSTFSLTLPHQSAVPTLATLKKLFTTFSPCEALLDPDPDGSPGTFSPLTSDPEHANSAATAVWEMALARRHYHPTIRILAANILSNISAREVPAVFAVTKKSSMELMEEFDVSKLKFNPSIPPPLPPNSKVLKKTEKTKVQLFQNGMLDLRNLKLQGICEEVLMEEEDDDDSQVDEPPKKMRKISENHKTDYNYFANFYDESNVETSSKKTSEWFKRSKDFTSHFIDVK